MYAYFMRNLLTPLFHTMSYMCMSCVWTQHRSIYNIIFSVLFRMFIITFSWRSRYSKVNPKWSRKCQCLFRIFILPPLSVMLFSYPKIFLLDVCHLLRIFQIEQLIHCAIYVVVVTHIHDVKWKEKHAHNSSLVDCSLL